MSFFHQIACCCGSATCVCPSGSAWTSGRASKVGIRAIISSPITILPGSAPPLAGMNRSGNSSTLGNPNWGVTAKWFSVNNVPPPCPDGLDFTSATVACQYVADHAAESNAWTASGTPNDPAADCDGGNFDLVNARCPTFAVTRTRTGTGSFNANGVTVYPTLQSGTTFSNVSWINGMTLSAQEDLADPTKIRFTATGDVTYTCLATWNDYRYGSTCATVNVVSTGFWLRYTVRYFEASTLIAKADLCGMSSVTISNATSPGWVPDGVAQTTYAGTSTTTCPSIPSGGKWYVGSGGAVTFSLIDCATGGGFGFAMAAPPPGDGGELAAAPPGEDQAFVEGVLAEADA